MIWETFSLPHSLFFSLMVSCFEILALLNLETNHEIYSLPFSEFSLSLFNACICFPMKSVGHCTSMYLFVIVIVGVGVLVMHGG